MKNSTYLSNRTDDLEDQLSLHVSDINSKIEAIENLEIDLSDLTSTQSQHSTAISQISTRLNADEQQISTNQNNISSLSSSKQNTITSSNKLNADLVDDTSSTNKFVTATDKSVWNGKQDALTFDDVPTENSVNPVKSGGIYSTLAGKQATLTSTQQSAINSGITSALVTQIGTNTSDITSLQSGKQDVLNSTQLNAVNSGITSTLVTQIGTNQTNIAGKQNTIDSSHKLNADLVDDSSATNKFVTASEKSTWNAKQNALTFDSAPTSASTNPVTSGGVYTALSGKQSTIDSSHKLSADLVDDTSTTNKFVTTSNKTAWNAKGGVYRGTFGDWSTVPTSASSYEADVNGNTTPLKDDYMILNNGSGKLDDSSFLYLSDTSGSRASIANTYNGNTQSVVYYSVTGESNATTLNNVVSVYYNSGPGKWVVKTLKACTFNNTTYAVGDVIAQWSYSSYEEGYINYDGNTNGGILVYDGVWGTDGKNGWKTAVSMISMTTGIQNAINAKQDLITNSNKLDYALLSNTPSIPSSYLKSASVSGNSLTLTDQSNGTTTFTPSSTAPTDVKINGTSITSNGVANIVTNTAYNSSSNKIATMSDVPSTTSSVTSGSTAVLTSGGAYTALAGKQNTLTFDTAPTSASTNPVTSGGVYTALSGKQNILTFDTTPTSSSTNPVTSGGVYTALSGKQDTLTAGTGISILNNVISAIGGGGGGGSSSMNIKFVTIDKTSSAIAGSGTVTAAPSYSQDVCNVQATAGSKFYVFSFTRIMNYKQHSTVTGQMKLQLKINNVVQQEVVNQKVKAAIGELLVAEYQATGNNDLISLDLTSLSNNSYASFCSNTTIIVGENITVSEITQQS